MLSWVDEPSINIKAIRYEDMTSRPVDTFTSVIRFAGWPIDRVRIQNAIERSSFRQIRRQEVEMGFIERQSSPTLFFRKGKVGSWRETLSEDQVDRLVPDHHQVMQRFGYLNEAGKPVY